jgi:hypothetical protein
MAEFSALVRRIWSRSPATTLACTAAHALEGPRTADHRPATEPALLPTFDPGDRTCLARPGHRSRPDRPTDPDREGRRRRLPARRVIWPSPQPTSAAPWSAKCCAPATSRCLRWASCAACPVIKALRGVLAGQVRPRNPAAPGLHPEPTAGAGAHTGAHRRASDAGHIPGHPVDAECYPEQPLPATTLDAVLDTITTFALWTPPSAGAGVRLPRPRRALQPRGVLRRHRPHHPPCSSSRRLGRCGRPITATAAGQPAARRAAGACCWTSSSPGCSCPALMWRCCTPAAGDPRRAGQHRGPGGRGRYRGAVPGQRGDGPIPRAAPAHRTAGLRVPSAQVGPARTGVDAFRQRLHTRR